jgi:thiamine-phosphate pyrophosphorylase
MTDHQSAVGDALRSRLATLHVLADDDPRWKWDPVEQARAACEGGAGVVQLRAKRTGDREALAWAREIRRLTRASGALLFVNDRFDLACLAEADGVHLGQTDLSPARLPRGVRSRLLVGRSTHDEREARCALGEPVDYLAFGPVFGTRSKQGAHPARGLARLERIAALVAPRLLVAIGGIEAESTPAALRAGADGVAVISAVAGADDPVAATRALVAGLREAGESRG